jgi:hypothetical protein
MITGILIDPKARSFTEVKSDGRFGIEEIYELTGCRCVSTFNLPNYDVAFIDDEGLLKGEEHLGNVGCYRLKWAGQTHLVGKTLIVGTDDEGETTSCKSTIEELEKQIEWVKPPTEKEMDDLLQIKVFPLDRDEMRGHTYAEDIQDSNPMRDA